MHTRTRECTGTRIRKEWPVPVATERLVLRTLLDCILGESKEGERPRTVRDRVMAAKAFTSLQKLSLQHQAVDRERKRAKSQRSLAEIVGEAEQRAEVRRNERDQVEPKPRAARRR